MRALDWFVDAAMKFLIAAYCICLGLGSIGLLLAAITLSVKLL